MKISDDTLSKIHDISIVTVAEKLGMKLYGTGNEGRRACCPYHEDQHPSLHFSTKRGCFKCFVCGAKGDAIKLVQDQENLSFTEACEWIIKECNIVVLPDVTLGTGTAVTSDGDVTAVPVPSVMPGSSRAVTSALSPLPSDLVDKSLSTQSEFCRSLVSAGYLTQSQMQSTASRYRLGATKEGGVIFWEIDAQNRVHTGKIMYYQSDCHRDKSHTPTWVHALIKDNLPQDYELRHCLFGEHLLANEKSVSSVCPKTICVVESEKTAVICSILRPECVWLSCGGLQMFKPELLSPLTHHKFVIFPDTDTTGETFATWSQIALQASKLYPFRYPIRVSFLLEQSASPSQKSRKIDIVDFIFETNASNVQT